MSTGVEKQVDHAASPAAPQFHARVTAALADPVLAAALAGLPGGLVAQRRRAVAAYPGFEQARDAAKAVRDDALSRLDELLVAFEASATAAGSKVHWARTGTDACRIVLDICRAAEARLVTKGKSMVSEEIGLNEHLAQAGIETVETDLGEYIVQMRGERPSHIIAPAIHLTEAQVEADFRRHHDGLAADRPIAGPGDLVAEARAVLREKFLSADVGITGANFLIAETGSIVLVTNEGNGDLTALLPKVHVVITSIEKVVARLADLGPLLTVLARSGTGQEITAYTSLLTGPRRPGDGEGPQACHIVLVDNGRSEMLGTAMREALRCIRCGACLNHCPVYGAIGGHAYGWVYSGPIGAVLTPAHLGTEVAHDLPGASTFCGRCEEVCPVRIPLVSLLRRWREAAWDRAPGGGVFAKASMALWAFAARRPRLYHVLASGAARVMAAAAGRDRVFRRLPFAGAWTRDRDLAAPEGRTFQAQWAKRCRDEGRT